MPRNGKVSEVTKKIGLSGVLWVPVPDSAAVAKCTRDLEFTCDGLDAIEVIREFDLHMSTLVRDLREEFLKYLVRAGRA